MTLCRVKFIYLDDYNRYMKQDKTKQNIKKTFCCCTKCFKNFPENIWKKNRGCLFCKWNKNEASFKNLNIVKPEDPYPCYIENNGQLLINNNTVINYKLCKKCKQVKTEKNFYMSNHKRFDWCISCTLDYQHKKYKKVKK